MPTTAPGTALPWQVLAASARGASHVVSGLPNQDAVLTARHGGDVVVAVADGHGHHRHFRSATGAALAVASGVEAATEFAPQLSGCGHAGDVEAASLSRLVPDILTRWRAALAVDLSLRPFSPEEQARLDWAGDRPEIPYGSTLLLAIISGPRVACVQIGDGDLLAVEADGRSFLPLPADGLLNGYVTTSLCQPDPLRSFRVGSIDLTATPVLALLLATDGYGNAQVADPWQPAVGADLASIGRAHGVDGLSRRLPTWAERCASSEGSGDDTTLALALNTAVATQS
jgi:Protein phosphatase 2C